MGPHHPRSRTRPGHLTGDPDKAKWQPLRDHLLAVADLVATRGQKFGARGAAALAGVLHDLGNYTTGFQRRIAGTDERDPISRGILGEDAVLDHHSAIDEQRLAGREARSKLR